MPKRPLHFSRAVEMQLANMSATDEQYAQLRAAYRHAVLVRKIDPTKAVDVAATLTASAQLLNLPPVPEEIELLPETEYKTPEHAIHAMAEFSGLGYEIVPALRASWKRAEGKTGYRPFVRASNLAKYLYDSEDADLLPTR